MLYYNTNKTLCRGDQHTAATEIDALVRSVHKCINSLLKEHGKKQLETP